MKSLFKFDRDPILYNLSDAQRDLIFAAHDEAPHVPHSGVIHQYLHSRHELSGLEVRQLEECPISQAAVAYYTESEKEEELRKERLKTDADFRKKEEESWERSKKLMEKVTRRGRTNLPQKKSADLLMLPKDSSPAPGDVWRTKSHLPWDTGGTFGCRKFYSPPVVLLLHKVVSDESSGEEWIVAPVEPKFVIPDSFCGVFEDIEFYPIDEDGETWMEEVAFTYFRSTIAVGQLDRPLYTSRIPDIHLRNKSVYYNEHEEAWQSAGEPDHLILVEDTNNYRWSPELYVASSGRYRLDPFPQQLKDAMHGCYGMEHSHDIGSYWDHYDSYQISQDMSLVEMYRRLFVQHTLLSSYPVESASGDTMFLYEQADN